MCLALSAISAGCLSPDHQCDRKARSITPTERLKALAEKALEAEYHSSISPYSIADVEVLRYRPRIEKYLPTYSVYAVTLLDVSGNPACGLQPLVVSSEGHARLMLDALEIAAFLSRERIHVGSLEDAREIFLLFCDLQSCTVFAGNGQEESSWSGYGYREAPQQDGWIFESVVLISAHGSSYEYWRVMISLAGEVVIKEVKLLGQSGGYVLCMLGNSHACGCEGSSFLTGG